MKPDDFSDQIRRKLESVEPEFREQDWTRMQQTLGHSTPVFAIGTKAGLMAAASVAAVMAFGGVAYQQYQANRQLHEQVRTLNQTVTTLRQSANPTPANPTAVPPDTVFLTRDVVRYVAVPVDRKRDNEIAETNSPSTPYATGTSSTVNNRPSAPINSSGRNQLSATPTGLPGSLESPQTNPQKSNGTGQVSNNTETTGNNAIQLALLTGRPFVRDTVYYEEGMARNARRMRRLLNTASPSGAALAKIDINQSEPGWKVRIGPGANLGVLQWGAGLFGEFRLNSHWRLGLGLTSMNLTGESFLTEIAYDQRTKQNFRRKFASGIDPKHDIINITPTGSSWQVPINVSYRFGLGSGWSLVPSAGVNLSLSNREEIGFAYLRGPGKIEPVTIVMKPAQQMLHAGSAAIYLEKNWGDWTLQLGPYASAPLSKTPSRLNTQTAGASARLLYQIDWKKKR